MKNVLAFIMAGGKGERLYPLTKDRAKPAVPFGGIYRIIDFTLSNCINSGIRKIHILTQYKSISLSRHIRMGWNIFDSELGEYIDMVPAQQRVDEHWYLGTADAIYQNIYSIEQEKPDYCLILAGDHIYKRNYAEMLALHKDKDADATVGIIEVEKTRAAHLGVVEMDDEGKIIGFEEKPRRPKTIPADPEKIYASMGIYIFNRGALEEELRRDAGRPDTAHDFGKNILPAMLGRYRVYGYNFKDENKKETPYWKDIGTIDAYYEANMDLIQVTPVFNLYDKEWPIRTYHEQFPPAKTVFAQEEKGGRIGQMLDSIICNGCIISGGRVQRSILSPNVRINSYSEVFDSVLMEGVEVGRYAKLQRAIIDKDISIPRGMEIGYSLEEDRKRFHVTESGIVVVAKGTIIE